MSIISNRLYHNMINLRNCSKLTVRTVYPNYIRLLSYTPIPYDGQDPAPIFLKKEVQLLLRELTRPDFTKIFRRRKIGEKQLKDPEYKFMTDEQLEEAMKEAEHKCNELLQIPPIVSEAKVSTRILSQDPALQGLESCRMVFTDITYGVTDSKRLIVIREPDGTLREAEWEVRNRINQTYFPKKRKAIKPPRLFQEPYFENLLKRKEYEFILDNACHQFEPYDSAYQRIVTITYQHINDNNGFDLLRSTRHFGALVFFLVWNKNVDNLLLELIETAYIEDAHTLLDLYCKVHNIVLQSNNNLDSIEDYIKKYSNKKGTLELGLQAYKDLIKNRDIENVSSVSLS